MLDTTFVSSVNASDVVKRMLAAAEKRYSDEYFSFFTEDALFQVGNAPPVYGPQGIRDFVAPLAQLAAVYHDIKNMWEVGNTVICQVEVIYTRDDGKAVPPLPGCNIIRVEGDKVRELLAYVDISPLFA